MALIKEIDYGTPALEVRKDCHADHRWRIGQRARGHLDHARGDGDWAPKSPSSAPPTSLEAFGSCRLCLVEIEGRNGTPASCTTPVAPGMVVTPRRERLEALRKGVMELYISDHPLDCLTCAANGDCELQDTAGAVGLREVRYGYEGDQSSSTQVKGRVEPLFHLSIRPNASSATAASAPARKCRAPSR